MRERLAARVAAYKTSGKIALLHVASVRQIVLDGQRIDVVHVPSRASECHSAITGLTGLLALPPAEMLADLANKNPIPA